MVEISILIACLGSTALIWLVFYLLQGRKRQSGSLEVAETASEVPATKDKGSSGAGSTAGQAAEVGAFYDATSASFVKVYGDVIQAFRTRDLSKLLDYQAGMMQLKPGMRVLDAGCGVCGPALFFAANYGVAVDAITASEVQRSEGESRIQAAGLQEKVRVVKGDYHEIRASYPGMDYDVVYFLESFGHSPDKGKAIAAAWEVLKPGGMLYVKDLFVKEPALPEHAAEIARNVARINEAYHYHVGSLGPVLEAVRRQGFILSAVKTIDIPLEDFENLTISNDFQELTGIHRIDNLQEYLFPVDFFELVCIKPWYDLGVGNSRYFLQNLYYLRVTGKPI